MRTSFRLVCAALLLAPACNAITGVDDLHFGGEGGAASGGSTFDAGAGGLGGRAGEGGGGIAGKPMTGAGGSTAPVDAGPRCGLSFADPICASCVETRCCAVAAACAKNSECAAFRDCFHGCSDTACVRACTEQHQCGLSDWFSYHDCTDQQCAAACGGGGVPEGGASPDAGSRDGGAGSSCDETPCDPVARCGCAAGDRCLVSNLVTGETACATPGSMAAGMLCGSSADCVAGAGCVEGVCKAFCNTSADCPDRGICYLVTHDAPRCTSVPTPGWGYCTLPCDVARPAPTCGTGVTCTTFTVGDKGDRATDCVVGGTGNGPGTCGSNGSQDCLPGYDCVTYTNGGTTTSNCSKWCRSSVASDCGTSERCVPYATPVIFGGVTYGYCAKQCDLVNPAAVCGSGSCQTLSVGSDTATDCFPAGGGTGPGGCSDASKNSCAPGYTCVSYDTSPVTYACEQWCVESSDACPSGTSCVGLSEVLLGGVGYSTCH